jgi:TM2 domain-containing membrane protein YozV
MPGLDLLFQRAKNRPKNRKIAIILALLSTIAPWPIAGLHKIYMGQPLWGGIYLLLWNTPIPRIACAIDAVWYFVQGDVTFDLQFNGEIDLSLEGLNSASGVATRISSVNNQSVSSLSVNAIAEGLRELDRLRIEGLVSEYEFEQKRRQLLDRIA